MVQDLSPATANPAFGDSILPGRLRARSLRLQTGRLQKRHHFTVELGVAIEDDITIRASFGQGLAQLLDDPIRSGVSRHIEVQDLAAAVLYHEEAVEHLEGHGRHGEEVERDDYLAVIPLERQPPLTRIATAPYSPEVASYTPFG